MRPILVVVAHVLGHQPLQMPLVQDDHVIQQVSSATFHPTLRNSILPRATKCGADWQASYCITFLCSVSSLGNVAEMFREGFMCCLYPARQNGVI
jgi:hypothetical protein